MKNMIVISTLLLGLLAAGGAHAAMAKELTYSQSTVWRCAVRFIRVDSGYRIVEKDKETGYLLFEYIDSGITTNASLEVLRVVKDNHEYVRVQINLPGQPKYLESLLFKKLETKLKSEYGMAPAATYVGPAPENAKDKATSESAGGKAVDEDAAEEDLEPTEDDLNQNMDD